MLRGTALFEGVEGNADPLKPYGMRSHWIALLRAEQDFALGSDFLQAGSVAELVGGHLASVLSIRLGGLSNVIGDSACAFLQSSLQVLCP